jgi:hypothetical protein
MCCSLQDTWRDTQFLKLFDKAWLLGIILYDEHYSVFGRTFQICTEVRSVVGIRQIGKWKWTNFIVTLSLSFVDVLTPPACYVMDSWKIETAHKT